jgi:membrane protein implicated in regulation of membrane protease activity
MGKVGWSARVVVRYALFQVPSAVLLVLILMLVRRWVALPAWFVWGFIALWLAKDIILFFFVWQAYDRDRVGSGRSMVGLKGVANECLAPLGYVRVRGELWHAEVIRGSPPINRGGTVRVRGIRGLTLLVEPDNEKRRMGSSGLEVRS